MAETRGFSFSPGAAARPVMASAPALQFVSGASLVPDSGIDIWSRGMEQASKNILAGITIGVKGLTSGMETYGDNEAKKQAAELKHDRDLELADLRFERDKELAMMKDKGLTELDQLSAEERRLDLARKKNELSWAQTPDGKSALTLMDVEPPLPEGEGAPMDGPSLTNTDLTSATAPGQPGSSTQEPSPAPGTGPSQVQSTPNEGPTASNAPIERVKTKDGGSILFNRATGSYITSSYTPPPEGPSSIQVPGGLALEGITVSNGKPSYRFKPTLENQPALSADQLKVVNTLTDNAKQDPSISTAVDARNSITVVLDALSKRNGLADITAINAFQRMVDPGVAVREGDVSLLQQAIPRLQRFGLKAKNWVAGDQLSDEVRKQMSEMAQSIYEERAKNANANSVNKIRDLASKAGVDPDYVIKPFALSEKSQLNDQINALEKELESRTDVEADDYKSKLQQMREMIKKYKSL